MCGCCFCEFSAQLGPIERGGIECCRFSQSVSQSACFVLSCPILSYPIFYLTVYSFVPAGDDQIQLQNHRPGGNQYN